MLALPSVRLHSVCFAHYFLFNLSSLQNCTHVQGFHWRLPGEFRILFHVCPGRQSHDCLAYAFVQHDAGTGTGDGIDERHYLQQTGLDLVQLL